MRHFVSMDFTICRAAAWTHAGVGSRTERPRYAVVCRRRLDQNRIRGNRWPPRGSLGASADDFGFGDQDRHAPVVAQTLREINRAMPEHLQVTQLADEDESALIKLYFVKLESFGDIGKQHGFDVVAGNRGFFFVKWNRKFELVSATVLIAEDKLSGRSLSHFVLEEVVQSMGLGGDSKRFPKSIFYENAVLFRYGSATRLAPIDRKLIGFLYQHVPAGSVPIEVGQLFEKHW